VPKLCGGQCLTPQAPSSTVRSGAMHALHSSGSFVNRRWDPTQDAGVCGDTNREHGRPESVPAYLHAAEGQADELKHPSTKRRRSACDAWCAACVGRPGARRTRLSSSRFIGMSRPSQLAWSVSYAHRTTELATAAGNLRRSKANWIRTPLPSVFCCVRG